MSSPAHDWPFVAPDQEDEKDPKRFYGVSTATVIDPLDPLFLGRVQVQLPFVDFLDLSPWARIAVPMAGQFSGFYCLPKVGDEVLVAFEHGDINVPYVIGSLWNGFSRRRCRRRWQRFARFARRWEISSCSPKCHRRWCCKTGRRRLR